MLLFFKILQFDTFSPILLCFPQNCLIHNVVLLALQPLSEHKCSDNGGYHASQEKEAFGSGEGQDTPQTRQPQNGTQMASGSNAITFSITITIL